MAFTVAELLQKISNNITNKLGKIRRVEHGEIERGIVETFDGLITAEKNARNNAIDVLHQELDNETVERVLQDNLRVVGPSAATDNAIARFDGTTGKLIQNSKATIDDNGLLKLDKGASLSNSEISLDIRNGENAIVGGADLNATSLTDNSSKYFRIAGRPWTNSSLPSTIITGTADAANSYLVNIGGGTSRGNAATAINFYTAAGSTTTTGTNRMSILPTGEILALGSAFIFENSNYEIKAQTNNAKRLRIGGGSILDTANGAYVNLQGNDYGGTGIGGSAQYYAGNSANGGDHVFYTGNGLERIRILKNGNIGINNNNPAEKLHVIGNIAVSGTVDGRDVSADGLKLDTTVVGPTSSTDNSIPVFDGITGKLLKQNGNVTIDPTTSTIHQSYGVLDTEYERIRFARDGVGSSRYHSIRTKHAGSAATNYISLLVHDGGASPYTSQKEVIRLVGNGNVGIGTALPTQTLTLNNASDSIIGFKISDVEKALIHGNSDGTGGKLRFSTMAADGVTMVERMRISGGGFVGIGTNNPTSKLHVIGDMTISGTVDGRDVSVDGAKLDESVEVSTGVVYKKFAKTLNITSTSNTVTLFTIPPSKTAFMGFDEPKIVIHSYGSLATSDAVVRLTYPSHSGGGDITQDLALDKMLSAPYYNVLTIAAFSKIMGPGAVTMSVITAGTSGTVLIKGEVTW